MESQDNEHILLAIIQSQDIETAEEELNDREISFYRLPSVGGFLGKRNATIIIHMPNSKQEEVIDVLNRTCRQRIEYMAVPLESAPLPLPTPTPITVGGATIFDIEIEHFEEL